MNTKDLEKIKHEMNTQDNLATGHPLFCVYEKRRFYGVDDRYADDYEWLDEEGQVANLEDYGIDEHAAEYENHGFILEKTYYVTHDVFVNAHFTMKAAKRYIEENEHNLTGPFTYVKSLYRCHEMIAIQEYLKKTEFL